MSKRILIVEDEESIADLEKDYLELSNFEVEVANDGDTGLQKGLGGDFDLIILDLKYAVRSEIRRIRRLLWFLPKKTILIKSEVWALERMII